MPDTVLQILIDVIYGCSKTLGPVVVSAMANGVDIFVKTLLSGELPHRGMWTGKRNIPTEVSTAVKFIFLFVPHEYLMFDFRFAPYPEMRLGAVPAPPVVNW